MGHEKEGSIRSNSWAVTSLYDGAKTRVRVGPAYSEEFEVKVGVQCHQQNEVVHCCTSTFKKHKVNLATSIDGGKTGLKNYCIGLTPKFIKIYY